MFRGWLLIALCMVTLAAPADAGKVIGSSGPIDRGSLYVVYWCPSHQLWPGTFVADGTEATIVFTALKEYDGFYLHQRIDNVAVVEKNVFDANSQLVQHPNIDCTFAGPELMLMFHTMNPADFVYFEQFHTGVPPEWDLSDYAYYYAGGKNGYASAFNDLDNPLPSPSSTGGSLGILCPTDPSTVGSTKITVTGLTPGTEYVLSFWWSIHSGGLGALTVDIYGADSHSLASVDGFGAADPSLGTSWCDHDGDGFPELFIANEGEDNLFFENTAGSLSFSPLGQIHGYEASRTGVWGDFDNDGQTDLFITHLTDSNMLLDQSLGFLDVAQSPITGLGESWCAAWADYDLDGALDLFLGTVPIENRLFHGNGNGTFSDVSTAPFLIPSNTQAAAWCDYDGDGDPDLYVADMNGPNQLLQNNNGTFVDVATGDLATLDHTTSVAWADYDNDLDWDLYVGNYQEANMLFRNDAGTLNLVITGSLEDPLYTKGVAWGDVDNDGFVDLYVADDVVGNYLYLNDGAGGFTEVGFPGPAASMLPTQGVAMADYDCDGYLDIALANAYATNQLLHNDLAIKTPTTNNWLQIDLVGVTANADAIGAEVVVTLPSGEQMIRQVSGGSGHLSQDSFVCEFGLGGHQMVQSIDVRWPSSSSVQNIGAVQSNQKIQIVEGVTVTVPPKQVGATLHGLRSVPNPFNPSTDVRFELTSDAVVDATVFDTAGRRIRVLLRNQLRSAGSNGVPWDGRDDDGHRVSSGVYVVRVTAGDQALSRRVTLLK